MDSVSLFVSQVGAAFGQPDMPAASVAFAGQPAPEGSATEMQFEKLFAELLGEAKSAMEPTAPLPAKPLESDKEPDAAPVLFLPLDIPQNPAPLPLDLLNLSLPKPEKAAESEAPRANTAIADGDPGVPAPAPAKSPEGKVAAFEGRLLEMQEPEPVPAAAPAPAAPKSAPPAAGRVAAASAVPAPAQRAGEKESSNRQPEGPLMMTESNRAPLAETEAEQVSAQPAARAEQVELGETQPQPPAAHGINVRLGDDPASTVHLRVAERAGEPAHFGKVSPIWFGTSRTAATRPKSGTPGRKCFPPRQPPPVPVNSGRIRRANASAVILSPGNKTRILRAANRLSPARFRPTPKETHSMSSISAIGSQATTATASAPKSEKPDLVSQDNFLQLLVAQIKNQDPLNPADGTQFLSQLAQFSSLEQLVGIRTELRTAQQTPATGTTANNG